MVEPRYRNAPARDGSRGPEVVAFAAEHGMELDEWQADVLDAFSGVDERGEWASRTNALVVARQNGKSEIFVARALFGLFVLEKRLILFSSHQWASSNELFLRMKGIIEANPALEGRVTQTRLSAAQLGFELDTGGRILFLTRSRAAARGFSGDEIYFDEAHFLSEAAHAALRPSAGGRSASGPVQMFYAASAVDQGRHPDGLVLTRIRRQGIAGEEGIAFVEYSAGITDAEDADLLPALIPAAMATDPEILKRANPGCPKRISLEFLLDEARTLDPASFWVEHGSQGDWPSLDGHASTVVDLEKWVGLRDPGSSPAGPLHLAFDVSPDRRRASIGIAGRRTDDALHVEISDNADGVGWLVPRLRQLIEDHDPETLSCDAAQSLIAEQVYEVTGRKFDLVDRTDLARACGAFVDLVEQLQVRHLDDPTLLAAIQGATTVTVGGDGWAFSRRSSHVDISPLYAAVIALLAVQRSPQSADLQVF